MTDTPKTLLDAVRYYSDAKTCFETMLAVKWPDGKSTGPMLRQAERIVKACGRGVRQG